VTDGLIRNPALCSFDPDTLVPDTLTQGQADTLNVYLGATRDRHGHLIYTGFPVSDLHGNFPFNLGMDFWTTGIVPPLDFTANEPWGNASLPFVAVGWTLADNFLKFIVERDPDFDVRDFDVSTDGVVGDAALALFDRRTEAGDADVPARLVPFLAKNKKLLIYHGFSDPALPPFRTLTYYEQLADVAGGHSELQQNARLFMAPGMHHCGGGPGPNVFDTLTPLENWVEHDMAPNGIIATHFVNNRSALGIDRTMPLCTFPDQAEYRGTGNVNDAANWSCTSNRALLRLGANGIEAGLGKPDRDQ
jgi:feruloyl esterase